MSKQFKRGLVIGKFYPPHLGHYYVIAQAVIECESVTVLVCSKVGEKPDASMRAAWIRRHWDYTPNFYVMTVSPPASLEDDDSQGWAKATLEWLRYTPEAVFTSEEYGPIYAAWMSQMGTNECEHVMVDPDRSVFPVSGRQVRAEPRKYWDYLMYDQRQYYTRRIRLVGAESTGTTTMARELAKHYHTTWVPEYGRTYYEGRATNDTELTWFDEEFEHIAAAQRAMEDQLARMSNGLLFCDTDEFATLFWMKRYAGHTSPHIETLSHRGEKDLYFLTGDEIPFVQDGLRPDPPEERHIMHKQLVAELNRREMNWYLLEGTIAERMATATDIIDHS